MSVSLISLAFGAKQQNKTKQLEDVIRVNRIILIHLLIGKLEN